jgi:hypothetical protein
MTMEHERLEEILDNEDLMPSELEDFAHAAMAEIGYLRSALEDAEETQRDLWTEIRDLEDELGVLRDEVDALRDELGGRGCPDMDPKRFQDIIVGAGEGLQIHEVAEFVRAVRANFITAGDWIGELLADLARTKGELKAIKDDLDQAYLGEEN